MNRHSIAICAFILVSLMPTAAHAQADIFYQDFRRHPELLPPLTFFGPDFADTAELQKDGLRITLPLKRPSPERVGVQWKQRIKGDFEITGRYAILKSNLPTEGHGVGVELFVATDSPTKEELGLFRSARVREGEVYLDSRATMVDGKRKYTARSFPTEVKFGQLKITRVGGEAILWAADENANDFTELTREPIGADDVSLVRFNAFPGHTQTELDVRLLELRIRALTPQQVAALPVPIEPRATEPGGKRWWPIVLLLAGLTTIGMIVGLALLLRRNRAEPDPVADETPEQITFACPGCGKKLRTKTSAAGKNLKCPECGVAVAVPADQSE